MTSSYDCHPERVELECPACGSDRVLRLAFPRVADELLVEMPERALGKCDDCGHRLTAVEVATQRVPLPRRPIGVGPSVAAEGNSPRRGGWAGDPRRQFRVPAVLQRRPRVELSAPAPGRTG
jgi:hypothetical protein